MAKSASKHLQFRACKAAGSQANCPFASMKSFYHIPPVKVKDFNLSVISTVIMGFGSKRNLP
jgi:hypothetical protein